MKLNGITVGLVAALISMQAIADGNRYDRERFYQSEVSAAEAWRKMTQREAMVIDVRRLREYAAGHPEKAYHVPFPHIVGSSSDEDYVAQDPVDFYWEVYNLVNGRTNTPIMLLCRTGARSVAAGNILANPSSIEALDGAEAFTHVQNIWEGFVGQPKEPYLHPDEVDGVHQYLDLNNDGVINEDVADVYSHTADANPDKDGWRNFLSLPWTNNIRRRYAYQGDRSHYADYIEPGVSSIKVGSGGRHGHHHGGRGSSGH